MVKGDSDICIYKGRNQRKQLITEPGRYMELLIPSGGVGKGEKRIDQGGQSFCAQKKSIKAADHCAALKHVGNDGRF